MQGYTGSFSFETLLCNIFSDHSASKNVEHKVNHFPRYAAEISQRYGTDAINMKSILKEDISPELHRLLFHERTHFWQLIACPLQQYRFVLFLENFGFSIEDQQGDRRKIAGYDPINITTRDHIQRCLADVDAHFRVRDVEEINIKGFLGPNMIDERTDMPLLLLPHPFSSQYPGYGGVMTFDLEHDVVLVPFTAQNLLESATKVSQDLYTGSLLAKPAHLDEKNDQVYLGAWEFWRRAMSNIYSDEQELALGFLSAVELATTADFLAPHTSSDELYENVSVAYRFGKIVYKARFMDKFDWSSGEPCERLTAFQKTFCEWNGWPEPTDALRRNAVMLTRLLIWNHPELMDSSELQEPLLRLFDDHSRDPENGWEELQMLWKLMEQSQPVFETVGSQVLKVMLNACLYQIDNPGKFPLPHIYREELASKFPLPLVCYNNDMCFDEDFNPELTCRSALPRDEPKLIHDCISLMTLEPLRRGVNSCGLLERYLEGSCSYVNSGLGCPGRGLNTHERRIRQDIGLKDSLCHWTVRIENLGLEESTDGLTQPLSYEEKIDYVYHTHLGNIDVNASIQYVCQQAGKAYSDIYQINCESGYWNEFDQYDHTLVFLIAGWIKENLRILSTVNLSQRNLAEAITEQTLAYLNARSQNPSFFWDGLYST